MRRNTVPRLYPFQTRRARRGGRRLLEKRFRFCSWCTTMRNAFGLSGIGSKLQKEARSVGRESKYLVSSASKPSETRKARPKLRVVLPIVWDLIRPRRGLLAVGLLLMAINRVSGLVLPYSTRYLIDSVIVKHHIELLEPLVLAGLVATAAQGITSFSLTQLLSKAAQRLIAELRLKVQAHVGHLPVAFYDSTKIGTLVSRIMSDVEGVRNLIGTGLVEFAGGLLTSAIALVVLFRISATMTALAFGFLLC